MDAGIWQELSVGQNKKNVNKEVMDLVIKNLIGKIKCLFGRHDEHTAFSWKTGAYATYCNRCDKVLEQSDGRIR